MKRNKLSPILAHAIEFTAVSISYLIAFYATFKIWQPLQELIVPGLGTASLLFLPHGIRVVVAWLYGLRGIVLLLPSAAITHYTLFGPQGFTSDDVFGLLIGTSVAPVVFFIGQKLNFSLSIEHPPVRARHVLIAGMAAAILNSVLTNLAYGTPQVSYLAYAAGDFFGQFACLYALIYASRAISRASR